MSSHPNRGNIVRQLYNSLKGCRDVIQTIDPQDSETERQIRRANDAINRYEKETADVAHRQ